ncbi:hypothetical protein [Rhodopirellula bahusiensis]|uniref:hypothetical protein n=1 Tax=Rhodopirellula bahusiensis TaxID=2014065 RepID=UPI00326400D9
MPQTKSPPYGESPTYLIAAAYAGFMTGDRELERVAKKRLADDYGIKVTFAGSPLPLRQFVESKGGSQDG